MKDSTISSRGVSPGRNMTFSYKRVPSARVLFVQSYKPVFFLENLLTAQESCAIIYTSKRQGRRRQLYLSVAFCLYELFVCDKGVAVILFIVPLSLFILKFIGGYIDEYSNGNLWNNGI